MNRPETCSSKTFFPGLENYLATLRALSANPDVTPEYTAFLKQLADVAQNFDKTGEAVPEILSQPEPFNYSPYFEALNIPDGDGRLPGKEMWIETLNHFQPRIAAYQAYVMTGGCELKEGYICDGYGRKILAAPNLNCPPEELRKVISPEEIKKFVENQIERYKQKNIEWFVQFLQDKSKETGLPIRLYTISNLYLFFAILTNATAPDFNKAHVFRHYFDTREDVASRLNLIIQEFPQTTYPPSMIVQLTKIVSPSNSSDI